MAIKTRQLPFGVMFRFLGAVLILLMAGALLFFALALYLVGELAALIVLCVMVLAIGGSAREGGFKAQSFRRTLRDDVRPMTRREHDGFAAEAVGHLILAGSVSYALANQHDPSALDEALAFVVAIVPVAVTAYRWFLLRRTHAAATRRQPAATE